MNPTILLTLQNGLITSAHATGRVDIVVRDLDIRSLPAAVERIIPETITLADMDNRLDALRLPSLSTPGF